MPDKRRPATWKFPLSPKWMVSWKYFNNKCALGEKQDKKDNLINLQY